MGREKSVSKIIDGNPTEYTILYDYDLSGKLIAKTFPDGFSVNYSFYPGSGLIHTVTGSDLVEYGLFSDYEPTGKIGHIAHTGNGTATTYFYDRKSTRLTGIVTKDPQLANLQYKTYAYSPAGDIEIIADLKSGITYSYDYDGLHRLISETNNGPTGAPETAILLSDYEDPDHVHAVSNISFNAVSHDFTNSGQIATRTITYNADNMPFQVVHSIDGTTYFEYDGEARRAKKTAPVGSTTYYIDQDLEIKNGVSTKFVFAGNIRIAKITGSERHYFHKDHLQSSTVMSNQSGAQVEATEYLPFGSMRTHTGTSVTDYKFTDQELDTETNLYNYDARLYDPVIGRFISPDSIVPNWFDPQSLNRYSYCLNNPLKYTDPNGHEPVSLSIAAGYASYALGTAIAVGIAHYAAPLAADLGKWLGEKIASLDDKPRSNPFTGNPGSVGELDTKEGTPKQDRYYGPDGFPKTDIDYDHHGGPHAHDWSRPEDRSRPTHEENRSKPRALTPEEKESLRGQDIKADKAQGDEGQKNENGGENKSKDEL